MSSQESDCSTTIRLIAEDGVLVLVITLVETHVFTDIIIMSLTCLYALMLLHPAVTGYLVSRESISTVFP